MYIAINRRNVILAVSETPFEMPGCTVEKCPVGPKEQWHKMVGTILRPAKKTSHAQLRVAFICNWNDACGISTYSKYLVDALTPKVKELLIISEHVRNPEGPDGPNVVRCWRRGESVQELLTEVKKFGPDLVLIQHEFGLFPKATYFLQLLQGLEGIPYAVTLHSVYEHLDKSVCTAAIENIVVHTEQGKQVLHDKGHKSKVFVIPHGCIQIPPPERQELWNIFQTGYAMVQFGFGFYYKGVDKVLDAIAWLKAHDPEKWREIFYVYLCSDNPHTSAVHTQYYHFLLDKIDQLGIKDNVAIIRKYQSEQTINHYLRTAKLALFPYQSDPKNTVYGASGAVRIAMANGIPVVCSSSHQFDDMEGVLPRPKDYVELAQEIDKVFSDERYRNAIVQNGLRYLEENSWDATADRYLNLYEKLA